MKSDEVIAAYIQLRDKKEAMKKRHKEELEPVNRSMEKIEGWLHRQLLDQGQTSMQTERGTAFLQRETSATVKDWDSTLEFIVNNQEWSFLEARVSKAAVQDYLKTKGELPPGVNYSETILVRVRR